MRRFAIQIRKISIKPMVRIAQVQPTDSKRRCSISGKTTPPIEPPVAARPVAVPRLTQKKWAIADTAGVKIRDVPKPPAIEKDNRKCQYSGEHISCAT